jgi:hypothetical protein
MRAPPILIGAAVLGAVLLLPPSGSAQTFACTSETAGQLSVQANVQCACRFFEAALRGTDAGYRWDCGILRARINHEVPATANPYPYPLPPALSVEPPVELENHPPLRPQPR